ncbi:13500_t:CDS:2, partial [Gigaspora margarita]
CKVADKDGICEVLNFRDKVVDEGVGRGGNAECESDIDLNGVCEVLNVKGKVVDGVVNRGGNAECESDIDGVFEVVIEEKNVEDDNDIDTDFKVVGRVGDGNKDWEVIDVSEVKGWKFVDSSVDKG